MPDRSSNVPAVILLLVACFFQLPTHKVPQIEELLPHRWKPEPR
ncbi:hypothetical protein J480_4146 [Acinetobacter baumannii 34654]|nr:hypothetical protein J480_4146 [Acinetobacter baumannii 34654]EXS50213.1 hypothetical protein J692_3910 [Acinetobacter baumannii 98826]